MQINSTADKKQYSFTLPILAPLRWLSYGGESASIWFFERGAFCIEFVRMKAPQSGYISIHARPLTEAGALRFSNVATVSALREEKIFPARFVHKWTPQTGHDTLLDIKGWREDQTIGNMAYGVADFMVDFFKTGALTVRAQFCEEGAQFWADVALTDPQINDLLNPRVWQYQPGDTLETLPWRR